MQAAVRMFRKIRIKRGAALYASAVVLDSFVKRGETSVVHVRRGQGHIAQRRRGKFSFVVLIPGNIRTTAILRLRIGSFVREALTLKQRPAMTVETIRAELSAAWVAF